MGILGTSNNSNNESFGPKMIFGNTMVNISSISPNQREASTGGGAIIFPAHDATNVNDSGRGISRNFEVSLVGPFKASFSTTQQDQAKISSIPTNSGDIVSSRLDEGNVVQGNNLAIVREKHDGDTLTPKAREGELH